ncbi:hypothetical protein A2331_00525 [Candidatus Falkowbacteria bacterium RIFOXYB2_FULL_34_18]|uniref:Uncharacterized protein n=1 Tax=Candidatus Falkowbacteria bacterium RIFOXYD2_FULL_34_120 TaxID=1798007 RepID=A0A1F5TNY9_9BACT|nr:MAG: hypothetical protein A2331_00525 [Candidatus Falkowbacteria bacterium RIFOXYB2_FULL_34_18]OGF29039.1 MAG: hypothetical protein A2500_01925 [Candidatus Falkowbacteria bacterium RIFOXYC12_FULL_34_55]OGF36072.1 MAG: hypothetical protein A2466_00225 [Candidatus Falkowbacteria bacterium RIFOXYC2_FULL_34_220]OGF38550.1 MAG: hypothetical protein A2515_05185 [Candidatus Falkowbacteria bacterium RIFOXYD12_FULL_34_57]OGF40705.1 MAG: hypothetical protein A2531_05685 [Candidatus Falkowbacteria bact
MYAGIGLGVWFLLVTAVFFFMQIDGTRVWIADKNDAKKDIRFGEIYIDSDNIDYNEIKYKYFGDKVPLKDIRWEDETILYEITQDKDGNYAVQRNEAGKIVNGRKIKRWKEVLDDDDLLGKNKELEKAGLIQPQLYMRCISDKAGNKTLEIRSSYTSDLKLTEIYNPENELKIASMIDETNERLRQKYQYEFNHARTEIYDQNGVLVDSHEKYLSDIELDKRKKEIKGSMIKPEDFGYTIYREEIPVLFNVRGWVATLFLIPLGIFILLIKFSGYAFKGSDSGKEEEKVGGLLGKLIVFDKKTTPCILLFVIWLAIASYWQLPNIVSYLGEGIGAAISLILPYILWICGIAAAVAIVFLIKNAYIAKQYFKAQEKDVRFRAFLLEKGVDLESVKALPAPQMGGGGGFNRTKFLQALEFLPKKDKDDNTIEADFKEVKKD